MTSVRNCLMPNGIVLGYLAREIVTGDEYRAHAVAVQDPRIQEICSVSTCISPAVKDFDRWAFNEAGYYPTVQSALDAVHQDRRSRAALFAYRLYLVEFTGGERKEVTSAELLGANAPLLITEEPPARFRSIGFDVVSGRRALPESQRSPRAPFGLDCSPLSCCGLSVRYAINSYCLLPEYGDAAVTARDFSREEPEPGPYFIVQVLRAAP